ncbi:uncharacterized protein LOC106877479 [Octopus bimaculoides]|uniref:GOLD domain-containing protein n=1 Tax=Octopus bimaculoides TaxID=37653 RepID=A0A0L8GEC0_OCTBM|nr:uncharacterized protein LOC106877479 [Octopus bimaculoides]|eukprot:XP_014781875.1 PREDICTED: endosomal protein P24B-like [Octopus bimaculoides]
MLIPPKSGENGLIQLIESIGKKSGSLVRTGRCEKMAFNCCRWTTKRIVCIWLIVCMAVVESNDGNFQQGVEESHEEATETVNLSTLMLHSVDVEFKFEIGAGKEECFYQHLYNNSGVYLTYEILRGGDKNIDFFFRRPQGDIAYSQLWQSRGTYSQEDSKEGVHAICFDNSYSHFSSKLVNFYFSAYIHGEILAYFENIEQVGVAVANISVYLENVHGHIRQSLADIITSRSHSLVDFYNVSENNSRVQYWSILQCIVIISTSCLQIFFVRRLFKTKDVTPSMKPRA